jgi:hypothetical protein
MRSWRTGTVVHGLRLRNYVRCNCPEEHVDGSDGLHGACLKARHNTTGVAIRNAEAVIKCYDVCNCSSRNNSRIGRSAGPERRKGCGFGRRGDWCGRLVRRAERSGILRWLTMLAEDRLDGDADIRVLQELT